MKIKKGDFLKSPFKFIIFNLLVNFVLGSQQGIFQ